VAYFGQHRLVKRLIHSGITAYRARRSPRAAAFFICRKQAMPVPPERGAASAAPKKKIHHEGHEEHEVSRRKIQRAFARNTWIFAVLLLRALRVLRGKIFLKLANARKFLARAQRIASLTPDPQHRERIPHD
jgi:hypothetical protein